MNFVKRHGTLVQILKSSKDIFYLMPRQLLNLWKYIPDDLELNCDDTGVNYISVSFRTMAKKVQVDYVCNRHTGCKRQITVVISITKTGDYFPPQLIYAGKIWRYVCTCV